MLMYRYILININNKNNSIQSASGKGRIYGPINIILRNYRVIDCMASINDKDHDYNDDMGVLIPPINQILDVESYAKLLIVIEKEVCLSVLIYFYH